MVRGGFIEPGVLQKALFGRGLVSGSNEGFEAAYNEKGDLSACSGLY